jgi:uncharacterized protein (TIGR00251 family)
LDKGATENMEKKKTMDLRIKVHPRSKKQEIIELGENTYQIHVRASPSEGKANKEVCRLIAKTFNVPLSRVKIKCGHKSRKKLIAIEYD